MPAAVCLLALVACALAAPEEETALVIPEEYTVVLETDIILEGKLQDIVIHVTTSFAPLGAEQFYKLVLDGFYNGAAFFRIVPNFVVQFGIAADPAMTERWSVPINDDPVEISNEETTITFATSGANTRTTQLFVNMADNKLLDQQNFAPFGQVIQGMDALRAAYNPTPGKSGGVDQALYEERGNAWIKTKIPRINSIVRAYIQT
ncbi:Peptidyl-prolyl cis-trans isomerase [Diplonema papillatum]|nr:Peptidyl-prolyl cis-trans isomerase [Diplonema papillatum]|eukprot:gene989-1517_t